MRYVLATVMVVGMVTLVGLHAEDPPAKTPPGGGDAFTGEYIGTFTSPCGKSCHVDAKVLPVKDDYIVLMALKASNAKPEAKPRLVAFLGKEADGKLTAGNTKWKATVADKALTAVLTTSKGPGKCKLGFTVRTSPTLGAKPPVGAVVLLPFEPGKKPSLDAWSDRKWQANKDGSMNKGRGDIVSKHTFGSAKIHVEFMTPYEPAKRGQGRGNSGVYVHGRYEVQVLDSFGMLPGKGDCGAIYGVAPPRSNASLPPLRWQTYDITFKAPKADKDGKPALPGRMTVLHNGVKIHENVAVGGTTRAGMADLKGPTGPLMLQDHGNVVKYRNIWLVEIKD